MTAIADAIKIVIKVNSLPSVPCCFLSLIMKLEFANYVVKVVSNRSGSIIFYGTHYDLFMDLLAQYF